MTENLLKEAQELYKIDEEHWRPIYDLAQEDNDFMSGDPGSQWNSQDYASRKNSGKPCLQIDQLSQFEKQVANEIRRNTPSIRVVPVGSEASIEDAEIYRGIIRAIEYRSGADAAYDTGVACAIRCSIGFLKACTDYATETGFNQEIRIERVVSPLSIMLDSNSVAADGSDAMHAWEEEPPITIKEFNKRYPGKVAKSFGDYKETRDQKGKVRIMRWYRVEENKYKIGQLADGTLEEVRDGVEYEASREVTSRKVKIYLLSGADVLEEKDTPWKHVPIVPVYGEEAWINGERKLYSLIRRSKDGQRMFNVWKSLEAEMLLQQPRAPILAAVGQTEDFAEEYQNPDKVAVVRYRQTDINGQPAPPPQRLAPPQIPVGIVNGARESVDDIKATMGIYNASLGAQSNETSGIAIQARKLQGDAATYHFGDNLVRAITQLGRVIVGAIPSVYDAAQIVQIINDEEEPEQVGINGAMADGQEIAHFLDKGRFDVRVITGSSYATKRLETSALMQQMMQGNPEFVKVAGDLMFKYMDVEGAEALSARFKKLLPPELQTNEENGESVDPRVIQMQQIIQQGMAEIQQLQAALQQTQDQLKSKQGELLIKAQEADTKAQRDAMDMQIKEMQTQIDAQQLQIEAYRAETERLKLIQDIENNQTAPVMSQAPVSMAIEDDSEEVLSARIQAKRNAKAEDDGRFAVKVQQQQAQIQNQEMMMNILLGIKESMDAQTLATQQLAATISAPRELVRDKSGIPLGTRIAGNA